MLNATLPDVYSRTMARYVFISRSLPMSRNIGMMLRQSGQHHADEEEHEEGLAARESPAVDHVRGQRRSDDGRDHRGRAESRLLRKNRRKGMETNRYR